MMVIIGTLSYEFQVILPLFAKFTFYGDANTYAYLTAAMGIGAVIGGLITANRKLVTTQSLNRAALLFGCVILLTALAPTLPMALVGLVLVGIFSTNYMSLSNTALQLNSTPEMRGRVMSLWSVAFLGTTPIGGPVIGWIGEHFGARWGLAIGGVAAIAAAALFAIAMHKSKLTHPKVTYSQNT